MPSMEVTSIRKPAPDVPELETSGGQGAHHIGQHEAGGEQRQRDQRRDPQTALCLGGKLRADGQRRQRGRAGGIGQRVVPEAAEGADQLPQERPVP